jgi:hypothetical protein
VPFLPLTVRLLYKMTCMHSASLHFILAACRTSSTQAGAIDPAELAMYAALMTSNTNVEMVEYLMAGCEGK